MHAVVTREDIEKGLRGDAYHCPIALSLKRLTGMDVYALGFNAGVLGRWVTALPLEAVNFMNRFDIGINVEPFTFEYEPKQVR